MVRREDGFTLVETVVVLAVVAILMGVIGVGSNYWLEEQRKMNLETLNGQANQALITYYTMYGRFPFEVCVDAGGAQAVNPGDPPVILTEDQSEKLMDEIGKVTSQRVVQEYDPGDYTLTVTYSNAYVAGMEFERR